MAEFVVCSLDRAPMTDGHVNAYFYPKDYESIFGGKMKESNDVKRCICISHGNKKVYKLYRGMNIVPQESVALDYESQCILHVEMGEKVSVSPISKFCYHWHTSDLVSKFSLLIGVVSLGLAVVLKYLL